MPDHVVDTNVLIVASASDPTSPFGDSDLPRAHQSTVFEWLSTFRADPTRRMVWDSLWRVYDEYRNKLTDQDYGLLVVREKMSQARFVDVEYDEHEIAVVPTGFDSFDPSDRKLLATVLADAGRSTLVNATDTDWLEIEPQLKSAGVVVENVLDPWLRAKYAEKHSP